MLFVLILILFFQNLPYSEAQKGFKVKFTNIICDPNPEWVTNVTCKINAINWKSNSIDVSGYTVKPISKAMGHIQLFKRYSGYRPFLFNFTTDMCAFAAGQYKSKILRAFGPIIRKYASPNAKCPVNGFIYIKGLKADVIKFPSIWPNGNYKLNVHMYSDNFHTKIIFLVYSFDVVED